MAYRNDDMEKRRQRREEMRQKQEAEQKRLKTGLIIAGILLVVCAVGLLSIIRDTGVDLTPTKETQSSVKATKPTEAPTQKPKPTEAPTQKPKPTEAPTKKPTEPPTKATEAPTKATEPPTDPPTDPPTEPAGKAPTGYSIRLSSSSVVLYQDFTVTVKPDVSDYTKIVIHAVDPKGGRWDFTINSGNSYDLEVFDASLTGTWTLYADVYNDYGVLYGTSGGARVALTVYGLPF